MEDLGPRERQIMAIIYRLGKATANEVQAELPDAPSNSAVRGMLRLLEEKGHLKHEYDGPRYVYRTTADPARVGRNAVRDLVKTFFDNSASNAVTAMLGMYEGRLKKEDFDRLEAAIDQAKKRGVAK